MCFLILFYRINFMCFADNLNFLLSIFFSFSLILSLLFRFVPTIFLKSGSKPKHFNLFVFSFNVSNKVSSTSSQLLNFKNFPTTPFIPTPLLLDTKDYVLLIFIANIHGLFLQKIKMELQLRMLFK